MKGITWGARECFSDSTPGPIKYCYDALPVAGACVTGAGTIGYRGRLTQVSSPVAATQYTAYDSLGRVTTHNQQTSGQTYNFTYAYIPAGLQSITYPAGRQVTYTYDQAARPATVLGSEGGLSTSYFSQASYNAFGGLQQATMGPLVETRGFNNRFQLTSLTATISSIAQLSFGYGYGTTANNGNLQSATIAGGTGSFSQSFQYDGFNRLSVAMERSNWSQTEVYDAYGNRAVLAGTYMPNPGLTPQVPTTSSPLPFTNNRLNGVGYDAAGNLTGAGTSSFTYDAENHQLTSAQVISGTTYTTNYAYDGEGRRVSKVGNGITTVYVYDATGRLAAEYTTSAPTPLCTTCYLTLDHLGSTRMLTNGLGTVLSRHDYLPFGEEIPAGVGRTTVTNYGVADNVTQKFTGKERDAESGLDYFGARYMSAPLGRFMSPDKPFADQHPEDPQSWNLYAYVRNNPLAHIDSDGLACFSVGGFGNAGSGFCQRADTYGRFDSMVGDKTRFFAAASAATQALADVAVPGLGRAGTSPETRDFLESTGQALLKVNTAAVNQIMSGQMTGSGPELDAKMVHLEQTAVQNGLDALKNTNAGAYGAAINQINGLLNGNSTTAANTLKAVGGVLLSTDKAYAQVLSGVRKSLGRDINFANQKDREAIGLALVKHVRETGGCDVAGNKANGCK